MVLLDEELDARLEKLEIMIGYRSPLRIVASSWSSTRSSCWSNDRASEELSNILMLTPLRSRPISVSPLPNNANGLLKTVPVRAPEAISAARMASALPAREGYSFKSWSTRLELFWRIPLISEGTLNRVVEVGRTTPTSVAFVLS